jgi:hypothetical protein
MPVSDWASHGDSGGAAGATVCGDRHQRPAATIATAEQAATARTTLLHRQRDPAGGMEAGRRV